MLERWISVEDRLPEDTRNCIICILVADGIKHVTTGTYDWRYEMWSDEIGRIWVPDRVTYWMPLPEPLEEVDRNAYPCGLQEAGQKPLA